MKPVEFTINRRNIDVLVFVPSMDEENGLVTCGNAILSGSEIKIGPVFSSTPKFRNKSSIDLIDNGQLATKRATF